MATLRLALAQMNAVVGGFAQNVETLLRFRAQAALVGADLVLSPELSLMGYPPEDLLLKEGFIEASAQALFDLAKSENLPPILVGTVMPEGAYGVVLAPSSDGRDATRFFEDEGRRAHLANVLVALGDEGVVATATKRLLPNYDVFDERRYFHPGVGSGTIINVRGVAVGLLVCEDVWTSDGPALGTREAGRDAARRRQRLAVRARVDARSERRCCSERALETNCPIAYVNLVGGQDELVFDGQRWPSTPAARSSRAPAPSARSCWSASSRRARAWSASPSRVAYARDERRPLARHVNHVEEPLGEVEEIYQALVMGTRDYLRKNGFREAIVALSGGVDSSLVAAIAVDAVGARAVRGFAMPSRYSSEGSITDALELAARLDIEVTTLPIEDEHVTFSFSLLDVLEGPARGGHRREPPVEDPRGLDDGHLQRDGRHRPHDRQQVRDGGGLLNAVR